MNGQQSEDMMIHIEQLEYHEDKVINGILHYLDGAEWREYSKQELTQKFVDERDGYDNYINEQLELAANEFMRNCQ
jgi:hypothetical protein